jgi:hypothetical protein
MSGPKNKKRGIRYRFTTSLFAGVLLVMGLAWLGKRVHDPVALSFGGAAFAAVAFGLVMFVIWSIGSAFRRAGERAKANDRASQPGRRGRRYGYER